MVTMNETPYLDPNVSEVDYRRGSKAAAIGFWLQLLLTVGTCGLSIWAEQRELLAEAEAFFSAFLLFLPGNLAWLILYLIYRQHRQERLESLTIESEAKSDAQLAAIFDQQGESFKAARKLLNQLYKYGLPIVSGIMGVFLLAVGLLNTLYTTLPDPSLVLNAQSGSWLILTLSLSGALIAFVYGRYVAGMTERACWRLLRGGGGLLLGATFILVLIAICAIGSQLKSPQYWPWLVTTINWLMMFSGAEILLSMFLGLYRPKHADEAQKAPFESRLLAWLAAPQSIRRIISETINYQFGFEVSKSAFYRFLGKAAIPLTLIGIAILLAVSSLVVVAPQEQAIITTFGKPGETPKGAGVHLKWPWPISSVKRYATGRIYTMALGSHPELPDEQMPVLWTNEHPGEVYLVTAPTYTDMDGDETDASPQNRMALALSGGQVILQYKITDLMAFVKTVPESDEYALMSDLRKEYEFLQRDRREYLNQIREIESQLQQVSLLLRSIAETEVSEFFATHTIEELLSNMELATGKTAGQILEQRIQQAFDLRNCGIEIQHVSLSGIHPPQQGVAVAFLNLIGKQQEKQTTIEDAKREAIDTLAQVAGSEDTAREIYEKIQALKTDSPAEKKATIEDMIAASRGAAARLILAARAQKTIMSLGEKAKAKKFDSQYSAYSKAPRFFMAQKYLEAREKAMNGSRFMIIDRDEEDAEPIIRMQMTEQSTLSQIISPNVTLD